MFNNELFALKSYYSWKESNNHYNKLWIKKEIIYNDEINYKNYKILIYPNYDLKFNINDEKIVIKKINNKINSKIKFKVINENKIFFKNFNINRSEINFNELLNNE